MSPLLDALTKRMASLLPPLQGGVMEAHRALDPGLYEPLVTTGRTTSVVARVGGIQGRVLSVS